MTHFYNILSKHSVRLECAFLVVHHTSKGRQSTSITDIGSGAGAMSRAADTHMTISARSGQAGCFVFNAVCRSWKSPEPFGIRSSYPIVLRDDSIDMAKAKIPTKKKLNEKDFVKKYVIEEVVLREKIISNATRDGVAKSRAVDLLKSAEGSGLIERHEGALKKAAFCLAGKAG